MKEMEKWLLRPRRSEFGTIKERKSHFRREIKTRKKEIKIVRELRLNQLRITLIYVPDSKC